MLREIDVLFEVVNVLCRAASQNESSVAQLRILLGFRGLKGASVAEVARGIGQTEQATRATVDRLRAQGFLEAFGRPPKRGTGARQLRLTGRGKELVEALALAHSGALVKQIPELQGVLATGRCEYCREAAKERFCSARCAEDWEQAFGVYRPELDVVEGEEAETPELAAEAEDGGGELGTEVPSEVNERGGTKTSEG